MEPTTLKKPFYVHLYACFNAIVTVVALYDGPQTLPLPDMYGKNLIFKTAK